jgi:hypothetical protein
MYAKQLSLLLAKRPFTPQDIDAVVQVCDQWFAADPVTKAFVLRAIAHELQRRWESTKYQIPTADWTTFQTNLLPVMIRAVNLFATYPKDPALDTLDDLAKAFATVP